MANIYVKGNWLIAEETVPTLNQHFKIKRSDAYHLRSGDSFTFFQSGLFPRTEGQPQLLQVGVQPVYSFPEQVEFQSEKTSFVFSEIFDEDGVAYPSADFFNDYLDNLLGSLEPAVLPAAPKGIQDFFISPIGIVGTGVGQADLGSIGSVPVILFDNNTEEEQVTTFKVMSRFLLADIDPVIRFVIYSTSLPVLTTGDSVRWQLESRYISENELATKSPDETLLITQTFPYITADDRQDDLSFTLDRTLMTNQDSIHMTLSRIAGDGADNYGDDVGVSESDINIEVTTFNP